MMAPKTSSRVFSASSRRIALSGQASASTRVSAHLSMSMEKAWGEAWGYRIQVDARKLRPGLNRTHSGCLRWHSPQAVHRSRSMYLGAVVKETVKLPASPLTAVARVIARSSMRLRVPLAERRGKIEPRSQLFVGKVRSNCDIKPPKEVASSMTTTFLPTSARSRAARIPPSPPPTTSTLS